MKSRILIYLVVFFYSCKPYYDSSKNYDINSEDLVNVSRQLNLDSPKKVDFTGKVSFGNTNYSIGGNIKIRSEESYQVFLFSKTLGIEIVRISVRNDSVLILDKIHKQFFLDRIDSIRYLKTLQLDESMPLKLFFGRILFDGTYLNDLQDSLSYSVVKNNFFDKVQLNNFGFINRRSLVSSDILIEMFLTDYNIKTKFPENIKGKIEIGKKEYEFEFNVNSVVNLDKMDLEFIIPNSYKRVF